MKDLKLYDFQPEISLRQEIFQGLSQPQKAIPAQFLYDERGSELFDKICELPEYYITRTEISLLKKHGRAIAQIIGEGCLLVEYGSGSSSKVRILLDALSEPAVYMAIDVSKEHMKKAAGRLADTYPQLEVISICADYTREFTLPPTEASGKKIVFFPGSTIGNLEQDDVFNLLKKSLNFLSKGEGMLIGVDLKKSPEMLEAAYNDSQGISAAFVYNLLARLNRELSANFQQTGFKYRAVYNPESSRVEIYLASTQKQTVRIETEDFEFKQGETIHIQYAYKYSVEEFQAIARQVGFEPTRVWIDDDNLFSLHYLTCGT